MKIAGGRKSRLHLSLALVAALGGGCLWQTGLPKSLDPLLAQRQARADQRAEQNERNFGFQGRISGRVTFPGGRPAAHVFVRARFQMHQTGALGENEAMSGPDGRYEIRGLSEQGFHVQPQNDSAAVVAPPGRLVQVKGHATGIDFVVEPGPWLKIRLLDAETGEPIPDIPVRGSIYDSFARLDLGKTNARGELDVQLRTSQASFAIEPPGGGSDVVEAPGFPFSREFSLKPGSRNEWKVRAYRGGLQKEATFRGRVVDESGHPIAGATVTMFRYEPAQAKSGPDGRFSFRARRLTRLGEVEGGRKLAIRAEKDGAFGEIYPTAEETWSELKLSISKAVRPSLCGRVVDFDGSPQSGVPICYYEWMSNVGSLQPMNGGFTDGSGRFEIQNLSPGARYRLRFGGWPQHSGGRLGFGTVTYPDRTSGGLQLPAGQRLDLGRIVVPRADGSVSGRLVDSKGNPAAGPLLVVVRGTFTDVSGSPSAKGDFKIDGVVREGLTLYVFRGDGTGFRTSDGSQDQVYIGPVRSGTVDLQIVVPDPEPKANRNR